MNTADRCWVRCLLAGSVLALGLATDALSQPSAPRPASAASAPPARTTAPTSATTRLMDSARTPAADSGARPATPQVAVPLRRGAADPTALKPGKAAPTSGTVDDAAARCLAARASDARTDCAKP